MKLGKHKKGVILLIIAGLVTPFIIWGVIAAITSNESWQHEIFSPDEQKVANASPSTASESILLTTQLDWIDPCVVNLTWTHVSTGSYAIFRSLNSFVQPTEPGVETVAMSLAVTNYQDLHNNTGTYYYMVQARLPDEQRVSSSIQNITISIIPPLAQGNYEILPDQVINFSILTRHFPAGNTSLSIDFYDHRREPNPEHIGLQTESIPGSKGRFEGVILDLQGRETGWQKFSIRIPLSMSGRIKYNFVTFSTNGSFPTYVWSNFWVETRPIIVLNTSDFFEIFFTGFLLGLFAFGLFSLGLFHNIRHRNAGVSPYLKYIYLVLIGVFFLSLGLIDVVYGYGLDMGVWDILAGWFMGDVFSIFAAQVVVCGVLLGLSGIIYRDHKRYIQKSIVKDPARSLTPLLGDIKSVFKANLGILLISMGYTLCRIIYLLLTSLNGY